LFHLKRTPAVLKKVDIAVYYGLGCEACID
jgi:hypothetical protein